MQNLKFTTKYKNNDKLRTSFFKLAADTFDINFERWYRQGGWGEQYIPFSFVDGDQVVANASVNTLELIIHGQRTKAIQIGTVMTDPNYRGKGLSTHLMNQILQEYEHTVDLMYLFANESVLDFYPKFGFKNVEECLFSTKYTSISSKSTIIRKLDINLAADLHLLNNFASNRLPVSQRFATDHTASVLMFYCLNVFNENIYYLEDQNVIVIYQQKDDHIELFDIISTNEINIKDISDQITDEYTKQITFHFTPDGQGLELNSTMTNEGLFVKTVGDTLYPAHVKHPITSIA
ncbi:GNAT family N-acetyltransferase [Paenibacillus wenxiniae]|uniref:GNAT family N-acetyltransferase n=1 Tax=Paenibacillus wenxiniae TaxID=1636843 RepID=A0ABW4RNK8_9BACL